MNEKIEWEKKRYLQIDNYESSHEVILAEKQVNRLERDSVREEKKTENTRISGELGFQSSDKRGKG